MKLRARWSALRAGEMSDGILWNFAALGVLAISGLVLQVLIGARYGAAPLGVFNQVFAWYVFVSQIAVLGAHFSVLKHLAEAGDNHRDRGPVIGAGFVLAGLASVPSALLLFALAGKLGALAQSAEVASGIRLAAPGLCFFALNKVALAALNGERRMRAFAVYQTARPLLLVAAAAGLAAIDAPAQFLPGILSAAELALTVAFIPVLVGYLRQSSLHLLTPWLRAHLTFGLRSAPSGVLTELNSRVDVIILGAYSNDATVGVYSFAAMLAEGVAQALIVLRNNLNPYLGQLFATRHDALGLANLVSFVKRWRRLAFQLGFVACSLGLIGYPLLVWITRRSAFMQGYALFALLVAGVFLASNYLVFAQVLMLAGRPGWHTIMSLLVVSSNALLNLALTPKLGASGTAIGTALALSCSWFFLKSLTRRVLNVAL